MPVIYKPKGRALEYAPLACNLYGSCVHGCLYCFAPDALRKDRVEFHRDRALRENILERLRKDCEKMRGDQREVLFCFGCDPYQVGLSNDLTTNALVMMETYNMHVRILTKGGMTAMQDFPILKRNNWAFGETFGLGERHCLDIEPKAAPFTSRLNAMEIAHTAGIYTWVSIEPVIFPEETLWIVGKLLEVGCVDEWRVGILNHVDSTALPPAVKESVNRVVWRMFFEKAAKLLNGQNVIWKKDLLKAAGMI